MSKRRICPIQAPVRVILRAVPSKSVTHRALVSAALASGPSRILDPLDSVDTRATAEGLRALGIPVELASGSWNVSGAGGCVPGGGELFLRDSGTSLRFLLAMAALGASPSRLDGSARLRERPLAGLAEALRGLGAGVELSGFTGGLPAVAGGPSPRGGAVRVPASASSQFASSILLIAPCLPDGIDLSLVPPAVSLPYVDLTIDVLRAFGAQTERRGELRWVVAPGPLSGRSYRVEGDHSSASYFLAAAAIVGGTVRLEGIKHDSRQPDARFSRILARLGCARRTGPEWIEVEGSGRIAPFDEDVSDAPDLAPTLAALALFTEGPCTLRGIAHLRFKESDRVDAVASALRAFGRDVRVHEDRLEIEGSGAEPPRGGLIATHGDHRIAMAFAVAGLRIDGVELDDAECVEKSYPRFWNDFAELQASAA